MNINWNSKRMQSAAIVVLGLLMSMGNKWLGLSLPSDIVSGTIYAGLGGFGVGVIDQVFGISPSKKT